MYGRLRCCSMRGLWLAGILVLAGCLQDTPGDLGSSEGFGSGHPLEGEPAPTYAASSIWGDDASLQDRNGTVTLVFIWASWCTVCKADEPGLVDVYDDVVAGGFDLMAVSHETDRSRAQGYAESQEWPFSAYWDPDANAVFGTSYQPNYILVDAEGTVQWVHRGGLGDAGLQKMQSAIESLQAKA